MFMPKMHHCEKGIFTQAVNEDFEVVVEVIASRQLRFLSKLIIMIKFKISNYPMLW